MESKGWDCRLAPMKLETSEATAILFLLMNMIIVGAGEIGRHLAFSFAKEAHHISLIEANKTLAEELTATLDAKVIHGDGTSVSDLADADVGECELFLAMSSSNTTNMMSEDNVMSCLQAHTMGVKNCLTLIHRADYADAISVSGHHLGIRAAVSPREATRREIQRFITTDSFHVLKQFDEVDLVELRVGNGSIAAGRMVKEVEWPPGVVLAGKE